MIRSRMAWFFIGAGILLAGCNSDDSVTPPNGSCDDHDPGAFSEIVSPESGRVYVWSGTGMAGAGSSVERPGATRLYWPVDVNFDPNGSPMVIDWNNHRVLAMNGTGQLEKVIGHYFGNPTDGPALLADLNHPTHVTFTPDGTKLILSAWHNSILMEWDIASDWLAKFCGTGGRCFNGDGQARLQSCLDLPVCALYHPVTDELYFSDQANHIIRRIDGSGVVHIVAGTAPIWNGSTWVYQFGYGGDGGPATSALLSFERTQNANPSGKFCFDAAGNIYIADTVNDAVRIVRTDGIIDTYAGNPVIGAGYNGDGGPATDALLREPRDVAVDAAGNLFIADTGNSVIRMVDLNGIITTVVGKYRAPVAPNPYAAAIPVCELHEEQGIAAKDVRLATPHGVEVDADGNVWISDTQNNVIRILYR